MNLEENTISYIKEQAQNIHHGRIIIEINETTPKLDVIIESRERFTVKESQKTVTDIDKKSK